ncbi:MAG: epoxyqueuosine reductase QueH [Clostridia bacterium]
MRKLLIHTCCAPCFTFIQDDIEKNGIINNELIREKVDMSACFYNPNIHPKVEYERRKETFISFCELKNVKNIVFDEYNLNDYVKYIVENVGEGKKYLVRCEYCYYMRLKKVFEYAKENNFDLVTTTLTISPYQNHKLIKSALEKLSKEFNVEYIYSDYRENFRKGQKMARELGLYMQKYCGCVFSIDDGKWVY